MLSLQGLWNMYFTALCGLVDSNWLESPHFRWDRTFCSYSLKTLNVITSINKFSVLCKYKLKSYSCSMFMKSNEQDNYFRICFRRKYCKILSLDKFVCIDWIWNKHNFDFGIRFLHQLFSRPIDSFFRSLLQVSAGMCSSTSSADLRCQILLCVWESVHLYNNNTDEDYQIAVSDNVYCIIICFIYDYMSDYANRTFRHCAIKEYNHVRTNRTECVSCNLVCGPDKYETFCKANCKGRSTFLNATCLDIVCSRYTYVCNNKMWENSIIDQWIPTHFNSLSPGHWH